VAEEARRLTVGLSTRDEVNDHVRRAFGGEKLGTFRLFASPELLWRVVTVKRVDIMRAMMAQGAMSIREVARRVGRDIKAVHGDVKALIAAHIIAETEDGRVELPYDEVRVNYVLSPFEEEAVA